MRNINIRSNFGTKIIKSNKLLESIKQATKAHHSAVEKVLVGKLKNLNSEEEYSNLLLQLHGFYADLEKQVHQLIDNSSIADINDRLHVANLATDLQNLGVSFENVENNFAATIDSFSKAFGVLYVMEGSTLGGQVISTMLQKKIPTLDKSKMNYFMSYGVDTMKMWNSFKSNAQILQNQIDVNLAIEGAKQTFEKLQDWLLQH